LDWPHRALQEGVLSAELPLYCASLGDKADELDAFLDNWSFADSKVSRSYLKLKQIVCTGEAQGHNRPSCSEYLTIVNYHSVVVVVVVVVKIIMIIRIILVIIIILLLIIIILIIITITIITTMSIHTIKMQYTSYARSSRRNWMLIAADDRVYMPVD
jgi:uncharacterized protein (DUF983 family)